MANQNFTLYLFDQNITRSQKINKALRTQEVVARYFSDSKELFKLIKYERPHLVFLAVDGQLDFDINLVEYQNNVLQEPIPYVFIVSKGKYPLLHFTTNLFNFGFIEEDGNLESQLKNILNICSRYYEGGREQKNDMLNPQILEKFQCDYSWYQKIKKIFRTYVEKGSLLTTLFESISKWDDVLQFSILSKNGKLGKIESCGFTHPLYLFLPSLDCDFDSLKGVGLVYRQILYGEIVKFMGEQCIVLNILGLFSEPDLFLVFQFKSLDLSTINLKFVEDFVSILWKVESFKNLSSKKSISSKKDLEECPRWP